MSASKISPEAQEKIDRIRPIAEMLIHACTQSGMAISGFLFSADPQILMHIGNIDAHELVETHLLLLESYAIKRADGNVIEEQLPPPVEL